MGPGILSLCEETMIEYNSALLALRVVVCLVGELETLTNKSTFSAVLRGSTADVDQASPGIEARSGGKTQRPTSLYETLDSCSDRFKSMSTWLLSL